MAESAVMGLRIGLVASARSMMTTCEVSATFSRTQMNLSDSIVRVANPICCTLIPTFWSCNKQGEGGKKGGKREGRKEGGGREEREEEGGKKGGRREENEGE